MNQIPHLGSIQQIRSMSSQKIQELRRLTQFGQITFDEVVNLNVKRELIILKSTHLSVAEKIIVSKTQDTLESQIFATDSAVESHYPVNADSNALPPRAEPVKFDSIDVNLAMAMTRWSIRDTAKLRGAWQWTEQATIRAAAKSMAAQEDNHVLSTLKAAIPSSNVIAASNKWNTNSADIESNIADAIGKIVEFSDIDTVELEKEQVFAVVLPAKIFNDIKKLKLIRNINDTIKNFTEKEFGVRFFYSRKPRNDPTFASWPIETQALILPMQSEEVGFLGTFNGGNVVPSQKVIETAVGQDVIQRRWFKYTVIPQPFDGSTLTNALLARIDNVA